MSLISIWIKFRNILEHSIIILFLGKPQQTGKLANWQTTGNPTKHIRTTKKMLEKNDDESKKHQSCNHP